MARVTVDVIQALRNTASRLEKSNVYQWGHMGSCNCGFLAQEITRLNKVEIHQRAMQRYGDWNEQLRDYCPTSGLPMDDLISEMLAFGFDTDDLKHLERLSDGRVLRQLPLEHRNLSRNVKSDVVLYLRTWASLLEQQWLASARIPDLQQTSVPA
jgi:hypothetical protein